MRFLVKVLASGLGIGYSPLAPGTIASLLGLILYYFVKELPLQHYVLFVVAFIFFAFWISAGGINIFGGEDPKKVVIDEIAGFLVVMIGHAFSWSRVLAGFMLFRFFDVAKPFPVGLIEKRFKGGYGIVLDDVAAAVYANLSLWALIWIYSLVF